MNTIRYKAGTQSGPFSDSELESFARMMRVDFPDFSFDARYLQFIQANNGGVPVENLFRVNGQWCPIDRFLNFSAESADLPFNVHQTWNLIEDRLDAGVFPFAALPGGDFLVFDHRASDMPSVMMWYHERSSEGNPHLELVAGTYEEFINQLRQ